MRSQFQHDTGSAPSSATRRLGKWWPQARPAGLKGEPQTEPGHEWIDCAVRNRKLDSKGSTLSIHGLAVATLKKTSVGIRWHRSVPTKSIEYLKLSQLS